MAPTPPPTPAIDNALLERALVKLADGRAGGIPTWLGVVLTISAFAVPSVVGWAVHHEAAMDRRMALAHDRRMRWADALRGELLHLQKALRDAQRTGDSIGLVAFLRSVGVPNDRNLWDLLTGHGDAETQLRHQIERLGIFLRPTEPVMVAAHVAMTSIHEFTAIGLTLKDGVPTEEHWAKLANRSKTAKQAAFEALIQFDEAARDLVGPGGDPFGEDDRF